MKQILIIVITILALFGASSCSTMQQGIANQSSTTQASSQGLLEGLLSGLVGNATTVTQKNLIGTWTYSTPDCRFQSENALAQAGGAVAASTVEQKLAQLYQNIGIQPGTFKVTFNEDNTCVMTLGGRDIAGTYELNSETRALSIRSNTGLIKLNAQVYYNYKDLTILFDAQKLLATAKMLATFTGKGSSTIGTVASMLESYDGLLIGMNMSK